MSDAVPTIVSLETFVRERWGLVRLTRSDGQVGWGQMAQGDSDLCAAILHRHLAPQVLGRALDLVAWRGLADDLLACCYKYTGTHLLRAIAGVDTAAVDCLATAAGCSVAALLGGELRPWPIYLSSMARHTTPAEEIARCRRACDAVGARACKIKIGPRHGRDPASDGGRSAALIDAAGHELSDLSLMADANGSWTAAEAIAMGRRLEDAGFSHYEEPCPFPDIEATAAVAAALAIPVAGGEQDGNLLQFARMLRLQAVDVLQCDVGYVGGLARALAVARSAADAGLPFLPHSPNPSLLLPMSLHLAAASPAAVPLIEVNIDSDLRAIPIFEPALEVVDGHLVLRADRPGWGLVIREQWLAGSEYQRSGIAGH